MKLTRQQDQLFSDPVDFNLVADRWSAFAPAYPLFSFERVYSLCPYRMGQQADRLPACSK